MSTSHEKQSGEDCRRCLSAVAGNAEDRAFGGWQRDGYEQWKQLKTLTAAKSASGAIPMPGHRQASASGASI
jgi:hypothetical protein